jgi:hypothetical protein
MKPDYDKDAGNTDIDTVRVIHRKMSMRFS